MQFAAILGGYVEPCEKVLVRSFVYRAEQVQIDLLAVQRCVANSLNLLGLVHIGLMMLTMEFGFEVLHEISMLPACMVLADCIVGGWVIAMALEEFCGFLLGRSAGYS